MRKKHLEGYFVYAPHALKAESQKRTIQFLKDTGAIYESKWLIIKYTR